MQVDPIQLCQELIRRPSVSPDDAGCQQLIAEILQQLNFSIENIDKNGVSNLWATRGTNGPLFCFAGHTDVVPTGPEQQWQHPPFAANIVDDYIYGRGAQDMKGALAAFLAALTQTEPTDQRLALLITSDEEADADFGTKLVMETLSGRGVKIDHCLIGEPSSKAQVGDRIRNGRRGSLTAHVAIHGKQGHVAYPHLAENPIHRCLQALDELIAVKWCDGNEYFPPTSLQISNINSGTGAGNVIPGELKLQFNLRYSSATNRQQIQQQVDDLFTKFKLKHEITWQHNSEPFFTAEGAFSAHISAAITKVQNFAPEFCTAGGSSDGRFIAPHGTEVIELGLPSDRIHMINERVAVKDLQLLTEVYREILQQPF